jgi:hypothetical protein
VQAPAFYATLILLHVLNSWLVYALGAWAALGYRLTAFAAGFFAVYEGHQEAVMWLSSSNEALFVLFGLISFLCWIRFLQGRGALWYGASLLAFCFALLSKESAVILAPLLAIPLALDRKRWAFLLPFAALAALAASSIFWARSGSFRFQDGSFSLHAPVWLIWPNNFARLFWFWGLLSVIAIVIWKPPKYLTILAIGLVWAGTALIPYSFLIYSSRIPSRQTYLASVGVAIIVGFALANLYDRYRTTGRGLVAAVCVAIILHNVVYLWTRKRNQFLERAAPTEQLIEAARKTSGPIYVKCFPRQPIIAESALELMTGRPKSDLIWNAEEARARQATATFCYAAGRRGG